MPFFNKDPKNCAFDMCTAVHLCGGRYNIKFMVTHKLKDLFAPWFALNPLLSVDDFFGNFELDFPYKSFKYCSQTAPNALGIRTGDGGAFYVSEMMDTLDMLMALMVGTQQGEVARTAREVSLKFTDFLAGVVRTKISFQCLTALAPLALSLLPALQKAACVSRFIPRPLCLSVPQDMC
jgi:hypothetical protein